MVKNHARKNAAKAYAHTTGLPYQKAWATVGRQPTKYLYFPVTVVQAEGIEPCTACAGTGLKGGLAGEFHPRNIGRSHPVLIPVACTICRGCGHSTHHLCPPLHTGESPTKVARYFARRITDGGHEPRCRTCYDQLYYFELGLGAMELILDTPEIAALKAAQRVSSGSSGSHLPEGYSLNVPNGLEYLRYPCDCVPDSTAQVVHHPSGPGRRTTQ